MDLQAVMDLAARQHGVLSRSQCRALGLGREAIARRIRDGELVEVTPLVVRLRGAATTDAQKAMAAVLDAGPGACISHDTALAMLGIPGYRMSPVHVWMKRGRSNHPARLGPQHRTRSLPDAHIVILRGVPMTTPSRTFVDQAAHLTLGRTGRLLDDLWGRNLVTFATIDRVLADLSRPGRTGLVLARDLLHERGPTYQPPASGLERRVMRLLESAGIQGFRRQVHTSDVEGWIGRVDFRHDTLPVILEVQSDLYHQGISNERADSARTGRMRAAGFTVLELREDDIWHRPDPLMNGIRAAVAKRRAAA